MATPKKPAAKKAAAKKAKAANGKDAAEARRKLFVEAYIANGGNATEAAKAAGYSEASARFQGSKLLADPNIAQQVATRAQKLAEKYQLTTDLVTRSIVQELTFDPARLYDEHGQLKPIHDIDEDTRAVLVGMETAMEGGGDAPLVTVRKVKWAQRQGAREHAMKHLGMFEADNKQRLLEGLSRDILKEVAERLRG